jgi:hypothetical protein
LYGQFLPPSGPEHNDPMIGTITAELADTTGGCRIFAGSEHISRLFIDDRKPVRGFAAVIKNYKWSHCK